MGLKINGDEIGYSDFKWLIKNFEDSKKYEKILSEFKELYSYTEERDEYEKMLYMLSRISDYPKHDEIKESENYSQIYGDAISDSLINQSMKKTKKKMNVLAKKIKDFRLKGKENSITLKNGVGFSKLDEDNLLLGDKYKNNQLPVELYYELIRDTVDNIETRDGSDYGSKTEYSKGKTKDSYYEKLSDVSKKIDKMFGGIIGFYKMRIPEGIKENFTEEDIKLIEAENQKMLEVYENIEKNFLMDAQYEISMERVQDARMVLSQMEKIPSDLKKKVYDSLRKHEANLAQKRELVIAEREKMIEESGILEDVKFMRENQDVKALTYDANRDIDELTDKYENVTLKLENYHRNYAKAENIDHFIAKDYPETQQYFSSSIRDVKKAQKRMTEFFSERLGIIKSRNEDKEVSEASKTISDIARGTKDYTITTYEASDKNPIKGFIDKFLGKGKEKNTKDTGGIDNE